MPGLACARTTKPARRERLCMPSGPCCPATSPCPTSRSTLAAVTQQSRSRSRSAPLPAMPRGVSTHPTQSASQGTGHAATTRSASVPNAMIATSASRPSMGNTCPGLTSRWFPFRPSTASKLRTSKRTSTPSARRLLLYGCPHSFGDKVLGTSVMTGPTCSKCSKNS